MEPLYIFLFGRVFGRKTGTTFPENALAKQVIALEAEDKASRQKGKGHKTRMALGGEAGIHNDEEDEPQGQGYKTPQSREQAGRDPGLYACDKDTKSGALKGYNRRQKEGGHYELDRFVSRQRVQCLELEHVSLLFLRESAGFVPRLMSRGSLHAVLSDL